MQCYQSQATHGPIETQPVWEEENCKVGQINIIDDDLTLKGIALTWNSKLSVFNK